MKLTKPRLIISLSFALVIFGCARNQEMASSLTSLSSPSPAATPAPSATPKLALLAAYDGTLPCADCKGVKTELALYHDPNTFSPETYDLKEIYLGTKDGDRVIESKGKWATLQGNAKNNDATIYQLNPDKPDDARYFLRVGNHQIKQLDRRQNEIKSPMNFTLNRQAKTVTITDNENNTQVDLNAGDTLTVNLVSTPGTGYGWAVAQNNAAILKPEAAKTNPSQTNMPGASGTQTFQFSAVKAGGGSLALNYSRPFEKGKEPAKRFRVLVVISNPGQTKTVAVTNDDNKGKVAINAGDTLIVQLKSNPTTGYSWVVADHSSPLFKLTGDSRKPGDKKLIGAPGTQSLQFQAARSGSANLALNYLRPFEKAKAPAQKFEMTVEIK